MLTLALDTATGVCTVGLVQDGHVLAEYDISVGLTHSEGLMPQLDQMFARTGIKKEEIDRIAVSIGPGSFTGLRIGLAAAEAMAYAWQCGICGVNTLQAMAYNIPLAGVVLAPVPIIFLWPVWCWRRFWMPKKGIIILRCMNGSMEN